MGIAWVGRGVIEGKLDRDPCTRRQSNRLQIAVLVLPVEIPVINAQKTNFRPVRLFSDSDDSFPEKMHVRRNTEDIDRHWQPISINNNMGRLIRRNTNNL